MRRALLCGLLAALLLTGCALAEIYEGVTAAARVEVVEAETGGVLDALEVRQGERVEAGQSIGSVRSTRVFASQDGTVARISVGEGDEAQGTILEIAPVERYQIYCTVSEAYDSAESSLVHCGEELYIKCTENGTHRGVGVITGIDGEEFHVMTVGGELYVGETVYLYRDADFTKKQRVGIGTVLGSDTQIYEGSGTVVRLHVAEGEYVERGELLYELAEAQNCAVVAPMSGIVTEIYASSGERVEAGQSVAGIVSPEDIRVEIHVDETAAARLEVGEAVEMVFDADESETPAKGAVTRISRIAADGLYTVQIRPEECSELLLGMSVSVYIEDK